MQALIDNYSFSEIMTFLITFALALKGLVTFWEWAIDKLKNKFKKESDKETELDTIKNTLDEYRKDYEILKDNQLQLQEDIKYIIDKVDMLIDSDKDDIKAFITRGHHYFCYQRKWIDDYSLDCIERRYRHYTEEGGNSFIKKLMDELRALPTTEPK